MTARVMLNAKVSPELIAKIDLAVRVHNDATGERRNRSDFVREALDRQLKHELRYPAS